MSRTASRRTCLRAAAAAVAGVGLAGCSASGSSDESNGSDPGADHTVAVGPDGRLVYDPEELTVSTGETVEWVWESDTHNIVVDSRPDGADWGGTEGDEATLYDEGHTYAFTFETAGTYEYFCQPHRSAGMEGSVVVE